MNSAIRMVFVAVLLAVVMVNTAVSADGAVEAAVETTDATINATLSTVIQNITVVPVVTTTKEKDDEKPITETIRTYIEEGVSTVKHAISKIGKFVGEFFEDAPTNTTVTNTIPVVNKTTVIPSTVPSTEATPAAN